MLNTSNSEYRKNLIHNGGKFAKKNFENVSNSCCVLPQYNNTKTNNMPYIFNDCNDNYPYMESDLKREYMNEYNTKCSTFSTVFK